MVQPSPNPPTPGQPYPTIPLTGVLQDGPQIDLVPTIKLNWVAQVLGSLIGAIGAACLGAGLGPYISPSTPLPEEAIRAIVDRCATKHEHCDVLVLAQGHVGALAICLGVIFLFVQIAVLFGTGPRWWRKKPSIQKDPGSTGASAGSAPAIR